MKKEADVYFKRKGRQAASNSDYVLLDTILAAFPMDDDRQQAERSWQLFVEYEEKSDLLFPNPKKQ